MVINENLSQTNTFVGGMNTDVADELLQNNQYRYAENIRVTADGDSKSAKASLINGLTDMEVTYDTNEPQEVVKIDSIKNYVCLITIQTLTTDDSTQDAWNIFVNTDYGHGTFERVFGPCVDFFWDKTSNSHGINTELYWTRDNNVKLYMSSPLRNHDIIYANLASRYNSGDISNIVKNETLVMHAPDVEIGEKNTGTLKGPILYYAYRLFTAGGNSTPLSPISKKITLYNEGDGKDGHGLTAGDSSIQSCIITVPKECFNGYDNIYIYRIEYTEDGEIPNVINITGITGSQLDPDTDFTMTDSAQSNANVYKKEDNAEFLSKLIKDDTIPSVLKIKDDRLYKADIGYSQDNIDDLFSEIDTIIQTSGNTNIYENAQFAQNNIGAYNENYWKAQDNTIGGDGEYISWRLKWRNERLFFFWANGGSTKCLRSEEQYRFGIVFYTNTGQHTSPMWMCDIMLPDPVVHDAGMHQSSEPWVIRNPYMEVDIPYIQFNVDTEKIKDKVPSFVGYEIVIAQRREEDTINITQGLYSDVMFGLPIHSWKDGKIIPRGLSLFFSPEVVVNEEFGNHIAEYIRNHDVRPVCKGVYKCFYDNYTPTSILAAVKDLVIEEYGTNGEYYYDNNILLQSGVVTSETKDGNMYYVYIGDDNTQYDSLRGRPYGRDVREFMEQKTAQFGHLLYTPKFKTDDGDHEGDSTAQNSKVGYRYLVRPDLITFNPNSQIKHDVHYGYNHNYDILLHPIGYLSIFIPKTKYPAKVDFQEGCSVSDARIVKTPHGNTKAIEEHMSYYTSIGGQNFYAWNVSYDGSNHNPLEQYDPVKDMDIYYPGTYVGQCMVMKLSGDSYDSYQDQEYFFTTIVSLKQKSITPYGGCTKKAIDNTKYISFGHYNSWTETEEKVEESADGTSFGMFGFMMYHNYVHTFDDAPVKCAMQSGSMGAFCIIPTFSRFDLDAWTGAAVNEREGFLDFDKLACIQYDKSNYKFKKYIGDWELIDRFEWPYEYSQTKPEFEYNARYNRYQNLIIHEKTRLFSDEVYTDQRNRIYASNPADAVVNEDGMLVFNGKYINIPSLYGDITCLANFRNRLYFWQEKAFGTVDIDERSVVPQQTDKDGTSHVDLIIGKGGLLDRYDYYSREYGMASKENCYVVTDSGIYWWDSNKREILLFNGQSIIQLATVKGVKSYTINGIPSTNPTILYDDINKEVIFSILNEESIVYSEQTQQFISVYKINPKTGTRTTSNLIMSNGNGIYQYDAFNSNGSSVGFNLQSLYPKLKFVVNKNSAINKTFDTITFGGKFYPRVDDGCYKHDLSKLSFAFNTDLNQHSELDSKDITDRENSFQFNIPRNGDIGTNKTVQYGNRMRGKTMECEISSSDNSTDFSLQYITTKFRISWT